MSDSSSLTRRTVFAVVITAALTALGTSLVQDAVPALYRKIRQHFGWGQDMWVQIRDERQKPIENVSVALYWDREEMPRVSISTDKRGRALFENIPQKVIYVEAVMQQGTIRRVYEEFHKIESFPHILTISDPRSWRHETIATVPDSSAIVHTAKFSGKISLPLKADDDAPPWVKEALGELGTEEVRGKKHNARIIKYHAATTLRALDDETPWNSSFVNWVFAQIGIEGTKSAAARSWLRWGNKLDALRGGCVAVFSRGNQPRAGHVGFVIDVTNDKVLLLGGNQGNRVSVSPYPVSKLLGCRWPKQS